jgi:hypothetical protein
MTSKTAIVLIAGAVIMIFSGWLMGYSSSKCNCTGDCCRPNQAMNMTVR